MRKLTVGRIVHMRIADGECRPVMVVHPWSDNCFNGVLFLDGTNDDRYSIPQRTVPSALTVWVTSITEEAVRGLVSTTLWHWPEGMPE
ncbi:MAG: hypothetical protein Q7R39_12875 [Dehalococcoidia bacterium]|nr:hypothetical protein [Dehalococcoidia bacterium]